MQKKTLTYASIAFVLVLLASALILVRPSERSGQGGNDPLGFRALSGASVHTIERTNVVGSDMIERGSGSWQRGGIPIEDTQITALILGFGSARATLVSRNGEDVPAYGLGAAAITLTLVSDKGTDSFSVGSLDRTTGSVYVSRVSDPNVYLVSGINLYEVAQADWTAWQKSTTTATSTPQ